MPNPEIRSSSRPHRDAALLEKLVLVHCSIFIVFTAWAFGGQAPWVRVAIAWWGAVGVLLFILGCRAKRRSLGAPAHPAWRLLWPLALYNLGVGVSCLNPGFKELMVAGESSLVMADPIAWLPSAARPDLALRELWQFNVIVLSCFNLFLVLSSRRLIRWLLFVIGINAVILAVFGTFQKLAGAKGLWFGLVPSPNPRFFATFIYHNHWGAFTLLNASVCLALVFHYWRRSDHRDIWHSPVPLGALATLLLAATVPLSASRSCTMLTALLLFGALAHGLLRLIRERRQQHQSPLLPVAGMILAAILSTAAIGYLGREAIVQRARQTSAQLASTADETVLQSRLTLYGDTWRMAAARPWFGWGLESYAHVFRIFNTQRTVEAWWWIPFYGEAHNDWLQSLAETGFVGTGLLALLVLLPLLSIGWRQVETTLPRYLLGGGGLILVYAGVEFPFANPAVMLTFCAIFYCAIRYAALERAAPKTEAR